MLIFFDFPFDCSACCNPNCPQTRRKTKKPVSAVGTVRRPPLAPPAAAGPERHLVELGHHARAPGDRADRARPRHPFTVCSLGVFCGARGLCRDLLLDGSYLCELRCSPHSSPTGECGALISSHNSQPLRRRSRHKSAPCAGRYKMETRAAGVRDQKGRAGGAEGAERVRWGGCARPCAVRPAARPRWGRAGCFFRFVWQLGLQQA